MSLTVEVDRAATVEPGRDYAVWSPDSAYGAAGTLLRSLTAPEPRP